MWTSWKCLNRAWESVTYNSVTLLSKVEYIKNYLKYHLCYQKDLEASTFVPDLCITAKHNLSLINPITSLVSFHRDNPKHKHKAPPPAFLPQGYLYMWADITCSAPWKVLELDFCNIFYGWICLCIQKGPVLFFLSVIETFRVGCVSLI